MIFTSCETASQILPALLIDRRNGPALMPAPATNYVDEFANRMIVEAL